MKIGVIKLGARISFNGSSTSGGSGEAISICKILKEAGCDVHIITTILKKDVLEEGYTFHQISQIHNKINEMDFNKIIVVNGSVNLFGGMEDLDQILNYKIINTFNGDIIYFMCDPNLPLRQLWPAIKNKEWASNWEKSDINITRNDIKYVCQARNLKVIFDKIISKHKVNIKFENICHFPFEKFPIYTHSKYEKNPNPEYDLLYGGTFRQGRREEDMIEFYFGLDDFKVKMFGKIKESNFKKNKDNLTLPEFGKAIAYNEFNDEMWKSISTVIIGDKLYKQLDNMAQRAYEGIMGQNIVFIDENYDKTKKVFDHPDLRKFNYIASKQDLKKRLTILNKRPEIRDRILFLQNQEIMKESFNDYSLSLKELL